MVSKIMKRIKEMINTKSDSGYFNRGEKWRKEGGDLIVIFSSKGCGGSASFMITLAAPQTASRRVCPVVEEENIWRCRHIEMSMIKDMKFP